MGLKIRNSGQKENRFNFHPDLLQPTPYSTATVQADSVLPAPLRRATACVFCCVRGDNTECMNIGATSVSQLQQTCCCETYSAVGPWVIQDRTGSHVVSGRQREENEETTQAVVTSGSISISHVLKLTRASTVHCLIEHENRGIVASCPRMYPMSPGCSRQHESDVPNASARRTHCKKT